MVFEKIVQPDSADDVARVVYSRRPAAEAARVNNSRHTCRCIYFSKTVSLSGANSGYGQIKACPTGGHSARSVERPGDHEALQLYGVPPDVDERADVWRNAIQLQEIG